MAFWGVEVKPGKPFTLQATDSTGFKRLHLSQATLGLGNATVRSILQCNVGNKSPLFLCVLSPETVDSCQLNLEFEEAVEVIFSVVGPRSIHLTGYFLRPSSSLNDDESESYGEDVADTDMEKDSSDDYDFSDSFINDDDPSARDSDVSSTDEDEIPIKKTASKTKDKRRNGKKRRRLRKKFLVCNSDSDETLAKADESSNGSSLQILGSNENDHKTQKAHSSELPLPSRLTRSKARSSTLDNGEPNGTCEAKTHTNKTLDKREDTPLDDVELPPVQNIQNEKPATEKDIKSSQNGDTTLSKKKRKRVKREETTDEQKNIIECSEKKKQATNKNIEKDVGTKKPEIISDEVLIEEIEKGKLDGKLAVKGKKVSIMYTGKLRDTGKSFISNLGEAPLRFRLGGDKVIKGLNIGVEGMRVGDKRRLIIPPSLGYSEEGLKGSVPKNAWLIYEVEAVKIR